VKNPETPTPVVDEVPAAESGLEGLDDLLSDDDGSSEDAFASLGSDSDTETGEGSTESPPPENTAEPAPAAPPASEPIPVVPPVVETQPSPPPAPVAPVPQPPAVDPAQAEAQRVATRQAFESRLLQLYAIDDNTAQEFESNPATVLPKIAAKLHMEVLEASVQGILQALPQVIAQYNVQQEQVKEAESSFFNAWPELNKPEYHPTVLQMSQQWRALNPGASKEEAIANVGALVMLRHQLTRGAQPPQVPQPSVPAPVPPSYRPVAPGSSGGRVTPTQTPVPGSFESFVDEVIQDDS
jgi:hypothetical protein